jgi:hypothetical protein
MTDDLSPEDEQALGQLRASLLRRKRPQLLSGQGDEAFDQHILLAVAVHRAARLYQTGDGQKDGWIQYVTAFFPKGKNSKEDAERLWQGWRCSLLKDERPVVPITHGQSFAHWGRDGTGQPMLNLEDAWDDYAYSVERFIVYLQTDSKRRAIALRRWRERAWTVQMVAVSHVLDVGASTATSASAIAPPEP